MSWLDALALVLASFGAAYLLIALLKPEWFE